MAKQKNNNTQPRDAETIQRECTEKIFNAGKIQYQIKIAQEELNLLNEKIRDLNHEGAARSKLDAMKGQSAPQATVTLPEGEENEQSA